MLSSRLNTDTLEITATGCVCQFEPSDDPYAMPEDQFSASDFIRTLGYFDKFQKFKLFLTSPGGNIGEGIQIMNAIAALKVPKVCVVTNLAASVATLLPLACDEVVMLAGSQQFLHMPATEIEGYVGAGDLRDEANRLDGRALQLAGLFSAKTGKTPEEILALMQANTWLTPDQCVELKLATSAPALGAADIARAKSHSDRMKLPGMSDTMRLSLDPVSFISETLGFSKDVNFIEAAKAFKSSTDLLTSENDEMKSKAVTLSADLDTAKASLVSVGNELETVKAEKEALKASIPKEVAKVVQAAGLPQPLKADSLKSKLDTHVMSRDAFEKLNHKERSDFFKSGGKLQA